ncbi:AAA family ATPase [Aliidiomarina soli]|uniref:ATPase AAA-type core domain-containing protein n=1 Tax=Aliidiomarina soli TaxID=1928574 RepID=A0A432WF86_9GAMM|nr:AAA family ATPase [Aliidiomarina soli]RUO32424.1 hypothetical protein CWE14_09760 [Aliidiomarina soli]
MLTFHVISSKSSFPAQERNCVYLRIDNWNDYSFVTMFDVMVYDSKGEAHDLTQVKIGFRDQTDEVSTHSKLETHFEGLTEEFFSLGQSIEYYKVLSDLPADLRTAFLERTRDIVYDNSIIDKVAEEDVFSTSLLRGSSLSVVKGQYARILEGGAERTDFDFTYTREGNPEFGGFSLKFEVNVDSTPTTNVHALIGRNGVGKTTILNGMIDTITGRASDKGRFNYRASPFFEEREIEDDYFSSLVSVSFSAFDPFVPPTERSDPAKGTCYFYLGLKEPDKPDYHRTISSMQYDAVKALADCFHNSKKSERWLAAIDKLGLDGSFSAEELKQLHHTFHSLKAKFEKSEDSQNFKGAFHKEITPTLDQMSSGHAIVFLTITKLVATVEEKTLVLLDEPESHLHPPLLSAFIRALSDLLLDRNGVAIIATHSPVVLQEIPKSCAWKIHREGISIEVERPRIETFGENVGILTSEVFGLDVERSGFHQLLKSSVETGKPYDEIIQRYDRQIGMEGRAILKVLLATRETMKK